MRARFACPLLIVASAGVGVSQGQQRIDNARPSFSLTIPVGFEPLVGSRPPRLLYRFAKHRDDAVEAMIEIEDLQGVLEPRRITSTELRQTAPTGAEYEVEYWELLGSDVNVLHMVRTSGGIRQESFTAQVPLADGGIQIVVGGEPGREGEYRAYLRSMLGSFRGELLVPSQGGGAVRTVMPMHRRVIKFVGGALTLFGYVALAAYAVYRLCLIGKAGRFIRSRRRWLAIAGVALFLGSVTRGMTIFLYQQYSEFAPAVVGGGVALLVLYAQSRLPKASAVVSSSQT